MSFSTYLLHPDVLPTITFFESLLISGLIFFKWLSKKRLDNDPIKWYYLILAFLTAQMLFIGLLFTIYTGY